MRISLNLVIKRVVPILFVVSLLSSCYYDNQDELHPVIQTQTCDTTGTITYANDILPILTSYCSLNESSCHSGASSYPMNTYNGVHAQATGGHGTCTGYLVLSLKHECVEPAFFMPQGGGSLNPCLINKIAAWVNRGALNN